MSKKTISRNVLRQWYEIRFNEKRTLPFLWRTKKIYTIYSGIARAYPRSLESDFRWTTRSLFYQLKRALFFMRTQPMAAARSRTRLSPLDANKSRNSDAPSTRGFRVCRWNLISAAFVTKHTAMLFFTLFPTHSFASSLTIHSSRSFLNAIEEVSRETRSLLKIHDRIKRDGTAFGTQIELNSCIAYISFLFGCIACQFGILWSQVTTLIYSLE